MQNITTADLRSLAIDEARFRLGKSDASTSPLSTSLPGDGLEDAEAWLIVACEQITGRSLQPSVHGRINLAMVRAALRRFGLGQLHTSGATASA